MAKRILLEIHSSPSWYSMAGISCHLRDYRLSYMLNQHLGFRLVRMDDLPFLQPGAKEPAPFTLFRWIDEERQNTYYLLANRSDEALLLQKVKQADFILLVEGPFSKKQEEDLLSRLRSVPNVLTAFSIPFSSVKNYEAILTDLEMHLSEITDGD